MLPPVPYVRRHVVEHAAAGRVLDERFVSLDFLPFVDAARLRPLLPRLSVRSGRRDDDGPGEREVGETWRRAAYTWSWNDPAANADALNFWCAALGQPRASAAAVGGLWWTRWARCRVGSGEILGRHTDTVVAVAITVLPDGRPVAVTGSFDATVRICGT